MSFTNAVVKASGFVALKRQTGALKWAKITFNNIPSARELAFIRRIWAKDCDVCHELESDITYVYSPIDAKGEKKTLERVYIVIMTSRSDDIPNE